MFIFVHFFTQTDPTRTVQRSALCRSRRELSNAYLLTIFGFDTAENEPCKICPAPVTVRSGRAAETLVDGGAGTHAGQLLWLRLANVTFLWHRLVLPDILIGSQQKKKTTQERFTRSQSGIVPCSNRTEE